MTSATNSMKMPPSKHIKSSKLGSHGSHRLMGPGASRDHGLNALSTLRFGGHRSGNQETKLPWLPRLFGQKEIANRPRYLDTWYRTFHASPEVFGVAFSARARGRVAMRLAPTFPRIERDCAREESRVMLDVSVEAYKVAYAVM